MHPRNNETTFLTKAMLVSWGELWNQLKERQAETKSCIIRTHPGIMQPLLFHTSFSWSSGICVQDTEFNTTQTAPANISAFLSYIAGHAVQKSGKQWQPAYLSETKIYSFPSRNSRCRPLPMKFTIWRYFLQHLLDYFGLPLIIQMAEWFCNFIAGLC